jgi:hypothetical protein
MTAILITPMRELKVEALKVKEYEPYSAETPSPPASCVGVYFELSTFNF